MKITKATHKAYLYGLFYDRTPSGLKPKSLPLDKLNDASSAAKKLVEGTTETEDGRTIFVDGEAKFTVDEWVLLRSQLEAVKEATIADAETINELKELFAKD